MQPDKPPANYLWNVLKSGQSYRNIAYLLLAFPAGLMYFIILITGISVGASLAVVGVGLFILWGIFGLSGLLANLERWLSNQLLQTNLYGEEGRLFELRNRDNWRAFAYLALKFPLGLLTFIFAVFIVSAVMGLITMPLAYTAETPLLFAREIDTLWEALVSSAIGLVLAPFALILLGKVALLWRNLNHSLLRTDSSHFTKKKKRSSREAIEQDVINRLIDDGLVDEESLLEQRDKNLSYGDYQ